MDFEQCKKAFDQYIEQYDKKEKSIIWKYHHSYEVSSLMAELAFRLHLSKKEIILAKVIGLLHDIGRFEQWTRNHSFQDNTLDHADLSCIYLFEEGHIRDFVKDQSYDTIIETAIRYHNKYEIPASITDSKVVLFAKMIRDMDKVDIYKQIAIHYEQVFDQSKISKEALEVFRKRKLLDRKIVNPISDRVLISCAFLFDIYFKETFDILSESDNFYFYLSMVEVDDASEELWEEVKNICYDVIDHRVVKER